MMNGQMNGEPKPQEIQINLFETPKFTSCTKIQSG
jgi:hypothetical protein